MADSDDPPAAGTGDAGRRESEGDRRRRDPARVEALSDGVFAIVVTTLVLEIAVPPNGDHEQPVTTYRERMARGGGAKMARDHAWIFRGVGGS